MNPAFHISQLLCHFVFVNVTYCKYLRLSTTLYKLLHSLREILAY